MNRETLATCKPVKISYYIENSVEKFRKNIPNSYTFSDQYLLANHCCDLDCNLVIMQTHNVVHSVLNIHIFKHIFVLSISLSQA